MKIVTKLKITDYKTGKSYEQHVWGAGHESIQAARAEYPRFSKIVLLGFEIDGVDKKLNLNRV